MGGGTKKTQGDAPQPLQPAIIQWEHLDKAKFYTLAPLGALTTRVVLYPTQLVKTRLQVQKRHALYRGTLDAFYKIARYEGFRALYKGFLPATLGIGAGQIYITLYETTKSRLEPHCESEVLRNVYSGCLASAVSQCIIVPVNVVSQRMMVHGQTGTALKQATTFLSATELCKSIMKQEGARGFYKGYWASVMAFAPSSGVWWASYDQIRRWQSGNEAVVQGASTLLHQAMAGAGAGIFAAAVTNPLDVVRARLQVDGRTGDGRGWNTIFRELWKDEGMRGMFKGVVARMWYMGANSLCVITAYETVKRFSLKPELVQMLHVSDPLYE